MKIVFKRLLAGLLCVALIMGFTACNQNMAPLQEAYNAAVEEFNGLADMVNKNIDYVAQETIDEFNKKSDLLALYKKQIESGEEISEEAKVNMLTWLNNDFIEYCKDAKAELEKTINEAKEAE